MTTGTAGYSGTPLVKKLGIGPDARIATYGIPDHYWALLGELPPGARPASARDADIEFSHVFATRRDDLLEGLEAARRRMSQDGMIWLSWPKKGSGVETDLDGNVVRGIGLDSGLVDVKVCAVDDTWSGLKFVIRIEDRRA